MKRLLSVLLLVALLVSPASAAALPLQSNIKLNSAFQIKVSESATPTIQLPPKPKAAAEPPKLEAPQPVVYTVVEGDSLSLIGTAHKIEWQRLWAKNTQIEHPDVIRIGELITIPLPEEQLQRELPAAVSLPSVTPGVETAAVAAPATPAHQVQDVVVGNYGGGNTYYSGQCTWYVKERRGSSIPNMLGNANQWFANAQRMGMATGTTPRAGAVGTTERGSSGHVVYVESVNSDGSIVVSEMNYDYKGSVRTITTNASQYRYIY
jgi:surface antigen